MGESRRRKQIDQTYGMDKTFVTNYIWEYMELEKFMFRLIRGGRYTKDDPEVKAIASKARSCPFKIADDKDSDTQIVGKLLNQIGYTVGEKDKNGVTEYWLNEEWLIELRKLKRVLQLKLRSD